jgi:hypothetical protein
MTTSTAAPARKRRLGRLAIYTATCLAVVPVLILLVLAAIAGERR